jgi:hypothetical protein
MLTTFCLENLMDKDHLGNKDSDGGIMLICILRKKIAGM